jgi:hypothetical protein
VNPLSVESETGTYRDVPLWTGVDKDSVACNLSKYTPEAGIIGFLVDEERYNIDAVVEAVERFEEVAEGKMNFGGSWMFVELGVREVEERSSAVLWRKCGLLM